MHMKIGDNGLKADTPKQFHKEEDCNKQQPHLPINFYLQTKPGKDFSLIEIENQREHDRSNIVEKN